MGEVSACTLYSIRFVAENFCSVFPSLNCFLAAHCLRPRAFCGHLLPSATTCCHLLPFAATCYHLRPLVANFSPKTVCSGGQRALFLQERDALREEKGARRACTSVSELWERNLSLSLQVESSLLGGKNSMEGR